MNYYFELLGPIETVDVSVTPDRTLEEFVKPLCIRHNVTGYVMYTEIPIGFVTDWGSVPRPFWWIPSEGKLKGPYAWHDYLYTYHGGRTRSEVDSGLRRAVSLEGLDAFRSWSVYGGVRLGGGSHWEHTAERERVNNLKDAK
jgi:hypothetical protein